MSTDGTPEEPSATPPPFEPPSATPPPFEPPPGVMPPGPPPGVTPPGPQPRGQRREFLTGLAIGAIPLIIAMVGLGSFFNPSSGLSNLLGIGGILWVAGLVFSIILSIIQSTRRVGLGMLTAILASPVIFFVGCLAALGIAANTARP